MWNVKWRVSVYYEVCMFGLILYVPSTIFQLNRDGSSWVEGPQRSDAYEARSRVKHSTTEPLRSLYYEALALNTLVSFKLLEFGDFLNLDRACLRCLIASLQSSLYHGLLLVGFVEV